ncbi:MAG: nuclear transport factor 2 family protein [Acidobacteriota bacterium]
MRVTHLLYALLAISILVWLVHSLGGGDEAKIEAQLERLGELVSKEEGEGGLQAAERAREVGDLLARSFEIRLDPVGQTVTDRKDLVRPFVGLRQRVQSLDVAFSNSDLEVDGDAGRARMAVQATVSGSRGGGGPTRERFQLEIDWLREGGDWRMETVRVTEREGGGLL